jgi:hypothetical protein
MANITLIEVERLAKQLSPSEQLRLLEDVARGLRQLTPNRVPRDLYGVWKNKIPADFDLDAALEEIRGEWKKELDEL